MRTATPPLILVAILIAATGCSSDSPSGETAPTMTAQQLAEKLKAGGQPLGEITVFDESSDPNHKLGRPDQYTSKVGFVDTRIDLSHAMDDPGDISRGGGIEVWPNRAAAQKRADYIQKTTKAVGFPALQEYDYVSGGYLLRITQVLTPDRGKAYEAALKVATG